MHKKWPIYAVFGVALVVNPYVACSQSSNADHFEYSEAEMKLAVLGSWQGTAELDGVSTPFSLSLEQASSKSKTQSTGAPAVRPQCTSRSFVKPAGACSSESRMPLVGTLSSENPQLNGALDGDVSALLTLDALFINLRLETGVELVGVIKDQTVSEGSLGNPAQKGTFSMLRP
jgi:hypothetical protein